MSIIAKEPEGSKKEFELVPQANHIATSYMLIYVGTIPNPQKDDPNKTKRSIIIYWETPGEMRDFKGEGNLEPMSIFKEYTFSLHEKANLRHDLKGWRGADFTEDELKGFDLNNVLAKSCMLNVIHEVGEKSGKLKAKVSSVAAIPKGLEVPKLINDTLVFDYDENFENLSKLPKWVQDKIRTSEEYKAKTEGDTPPF
jgi:hypothetical protein